jgi:hypothetical protein
MNRRTAALTLTTLAGLATGLARPAAAAAAAQRVSYSAETNGQTTLIQLQIESGLVTGEMREGALTLALKGVLQGQRLQARLLLPGTELAVAALDAELRGDTLDLSVQAQAGVAPTRLVMRRVGAAAAPTTAATAASTATAAGAGAVDPRLAGRWRHESMINSPGGAGGFASFSTVRTLVLAADGRVQQSVQSAGGGGNWSHASGDKVEFQGRWMARDGQLWVQADGGADFQSAGRYRMVDQMLVIEGGRGRTIWQR